MTEASSRPVILFILGREINLYSPTKNEGMAVKDFKLFEQLHKELPQDKFRILLAHDFLRVKEFTKEEKNILQVQHNIYSHEEKGKFWLCAMESTELKGKNFEYFKQEELYETKPDEINKANIIISPKQIFLPALFASRQNAALLSKALIPPSGSDISKYEAQSKWGTSSISYREIAASETTPLEQISAILTSPHTNDLKGADAIAIMKGQQDLVTGLVRTRWGEP